MAFFLYTNGQFRNHFFDYLSPEAEKARLEKTLPAGLPQKKNSRNPKGKQYFAIEVMSKHLITLKGDTPLPEAMALLEKRKIHHIPVVNNNEELMGMISDRDLLKLDGDSLFNLISLKDIMSTLVIVAHEETEVGQIARVLVREKVSAIPIVNKDMKLVGIVSRVDILKLVVDHQFLD